VVLDRRCGHPIQIHIRDHYAVVFYRRYRSQGRGPGRHDTRQPVTAGLAASPANGRFRNLSVAARTSEGPQSTSTAAYFPTIQDGPPSAAQRAESAPVRKPIASTADRKAPARLAGPRRHTQRMFYLNVNQSRGSRRGRKEARLRGS
jgi:hypothetical protein